MNKVFMRCKNWSENPVVLWAIFSLTLAASFYRGYGFSNNSYAIASWLVTYEGGFIKRGLIGSILQLEFLSRMSGISIPTLFFIFTNILLVSLHILVLIIVMRMVSLNKAALFFIPYFLIGPLLRTQSVWIGNIDHLLAILMIAMTYCLIKEKFYLAIFISVIGSFIHEIIISMVFPLFSFWILTRLVSEKREKSIHFNKMVAGLLINTLVLFFIIFYQDMIFSGDHASSYIDNLLSRQPEGNYNSGAITEVYTTSFWDWFVFQKGEFPNRIGDPALFFVFIAPAICFLLNIFLSSKKLKRDFYIFIGSIILVCLPLSVLAIAWDIDRVWNLSIWVLFLILWLKFEEKTISAPRQWLGSFISVVISAPAFLMPQIRSNIEWNLLWLIYSPFVIWEFIFLVGRMSKAAKDSVRPTLS